MTITALKNRLEKIESSKKANFKSVYDALLNIPSDKSKTTSDIYLWLHSCGFILEEIVEFTRRDDIE